MQERKRYSNEFKQNAVSLVVEQGYSRAEAARNLALWPGELLFSLRYLAVGSTWRAQ